MGQWIEACGTDEISEGAMRSITLEGKEILLARASDRFYAAENRCPHMGARLSEGALAGTVVTCPRHGSRFALTDGKVIEWAKLPPIISKVSKMIRRPRGLLTFPVKVENGRISVEI
ncbi:MAG: Rieske (2Fe-2S) protein [Chloroflexi bacterium]|nr:Rieske (2Fe-2S) protein [Chloroflexota bacterium]